MAERSPPETRKRSNSSSSISNNIVVAESLRRGKWTSEEEAYANKIIAFFNKGLIPNVEQGITLRTYLSDKLQCDPMRITKKYAGASCIGKQIFQTNVYTNPQYAAMLRDAENELKQLENNFHARIGNKITSSTTVNRPTVNTRKPNKVQEYSSSSSNSNFDDSDDYGDGDGDDEFDSEYEKVKMFRGPNDVYNNTTSIRRVISAPDMSLYNESAKFSFKLLNENVKTVEGESLINSNSFSTLKHRDRSQSAMDLREFERFVADDQAAGSLLMVFYDKMQQNYQSIVDVSEEKSAVDSIFEDKTDKSSGSPGSFMFTNLKTSDDSVVTQKTFNSNSSSPVGLSIVDMDSLDLEIKSDPNNSLKHITSQFPFGHKANSSKSYENI